MSAVTNLYIKSLLGEGAAVITSNADTVVVSVPNVTLESADAPGESLVVEGAGPNLVVKTIQGAGTVSVYPDPNGNVLYVESTSTDVRLTSAGYGTNLVYDAIGPEVSLKSLATTETTLFVDDDGSGTVTIGTQGYRVSADLNSFDIPTDTWYYATFDNIVSVPANGPYQDTVAGSGSPSWVTSLSNAGLIDGAHGGTPGNDQAFVHITFSVPSTVVNTLSASRFLALAVIQVQNGTAQYVAEVRQFRFADFGANMFVRQTDGHLVGGLSLYTKLYGSQYAIGVYHNVGALVSIGDVDWPLESLITWGIPGPAPMPKSSLSFQKFSLRSPIEPPVSPLKVVNTTSQAISTAVATKLLFPDVLAASTDISWDAGTSTGTAVVGGDYCVLAGLETTTSAVIVNSRLAVRVNGTYSKAQAMGLVQASTSSPLSMVVADIVHLNPGDTIEIYFLNINSVATATVPNSGLSVYLDIARLTPAINGVSP